MANKIYSTQKLETSVVGPDIITGKPAQIEYSVRFTNDGDAADTFDAHVQCDGSDLDFQNECRKYLQERFPAAPTDASNPTHQFQVGDNVVNILS